MKILKYIKLLPVLSILISLSSCKDFLDENNVGGKFDTDVVWNNPAFAEGVLLHVYKSLPQNFITTSDYVANDAVTNDLTNSSRDMAMGGWSERENPISNYNKAFTMFMQVNDFLTHVDSVDFAPLSEQEVKDKYVKKLKAEAYGLRAWWGSELLTTCGGESADGILLGYPIVYNVITDVEAAKLPRNTYADCVAQIVSDCDEALKGLPLKWEDIDDENEDEINGERNVNRINALAVKIIKSRVLLRAASPAFAASGTTWESAANAAAEVLQDNGGLSVLDPDDVTFYDKGYDEGALNASPEIIWYFNLKQENTDREEDYYPPTLYGKGSLNPSKNLVEAFPAKNGYPVGDAMASEGKDPRMEKYIVSNGSTLSGKVILTTSTDDAIGASVNATRTGYYLRKFLNESVDLTPSAVKKGASYFVNLRYTEALLNFAEAANEVGGPGFVVNGFSARQVINAIRTRAGIESEDYANSLDADGMRKLIRNERRLELCFEGFRFWDMCRWMDLTAMNTDVTGFEAKTDEVIDVEVRQFDDYMIYAPIPSKERVLGIIQNKGWK